MSYPHGGEDVVLKNLTPEGFAAFKLPSVSMPVIFVPNHGRDQQFGAVADTILIEPDQRRFMITWRASIPLRRNCFEFRRIIAGEPGPCAISVRRTGLKPHYPSIADYIRAKRGKGK